MVGYLLLIYLCSANLVIGETDPFVFLLSLSLSSPISRHYFHRLFTSLALSESLTLFSTANFAGNTRLELASLSMFKSRH